MVLCEACKVELKSHTRTRSPIPTQISSSVLKSSLQAPRGFGLPLFDLNLNSAIYFLYPHETVEEHTLATRMSRNPFTGSEIMRDELYSRPFYNYSS